jgi:predicted secreted protein
MTRRQVPKPKGTKEQGDQKFSAIYKRSWEPVTGNETAYSVTIRVVKP